MKEIKHVQASLSKCCTNINSLSAEWFTHASELSAKIGANEPKIPRLCKRQAHRENIPTDVPETYFRTSVAIPFVDHLLAQMTSRFGPIQKRMSLGFAVIPSMMAHHEAWIDSVIV